MSEAVSAAPQILPSPSVLDDIELIRQGVAVPIASLGELVASSLTHERTLDDLREIVLVEPEGVPIAAVPVMSVAGKDDAVFAAGPVRFIARRPDRPFESMHRVVETVPTPQVTVVLDHSVNANELADYLQPNLSVLLLVVASVELEGEANSQAIGVCRHIRDLRDDLRQTRFGLSQIDMVIVPIARDHPHRQERIQESAAAYARGGLVADLTRVEERATDPSAGTVLFFTGLSGSGKSTLARAVRNRLVEHTDRTVTLLDGDVVRRHLSAGLGFSVADRDINVCRIGWVAARIAEHGGLAIASPIAPFERTRKAVEHMVLSAGGRFVLVHVSTPLEECERRDRKGLYARARRGEIPEFTGISSPYEDPVDPDIRLDTSGVDVDDLVDRILDSALWSRPLNSNP